MTSQFYKAALDSLTETEPQTLTGLIEAVTAEFAPATKLAS